MRKQPAKRYEVLGGHLIRGSRDHATMREACEAIERQRAGLVASEWPDGSVGYYLAQEHADADDSGEWAAAIAREQVE